MRINECARVVAAWALISTPFVSTAVSAGGMDGSKNIVCAVVDVVGCAEDGGCIEGTAKSFDLPEFMILDAGQNVIRASYESGHKAVSPVRNLQRDKDHLMLQGVENGLGWNIAINTMSGRMSASGVGDSVSFLAFGACTAL